jgi:hypothetical protein
MDARTLARLSHVCRRWGGQLQILTKQQFDQQFRTDTSTSRIYRSRRYGVSVAPFVPDGVRLGCIYSQKIVALVPHRSLHCCYVLHEMAHVLACRQPPDESDEFDFLGWEWVMAKRFGVSCRQWRFLNRDYGLGAEYGCQTLGKVPLPTFKKVMKKMMARGARVGNLKDGRPTAVR